MLNINIFSNELQIIKSNNQHIKHKNDFVLFKLQQLLSHEFNC